MIFSKLPRFFLGCVGAVLLLDALAFFAVGRFNFGVIVPFVLGASFLLLAIYQVRWMQWVNLKPFRVVAWRAIVFGFCLWLMSLLAFFVFLQQRTNTTNGSMESTPAKAIIVLGSGTPNCQPSLALIERLKQGQAFAMHNMPAWLIVSGGVDFGNTCSEAEVMAAYLAQQKMDMSRVLQERASTSTHENLIFSERLLLEKSISKSDAIQIVTSDFHTLRAEKIAIRAGYSNVQLIPAPTPLFMRYNAWTREYFAFISGWLLNEY